MSSAGLGLFFTAIISQRLYRPKQRWAGVTNIIELLGRSTFCQVCGIELYKSLTSGSWGQLSPSNSAQGGIQEKEKKAVS